MESKLFGGFTYCEDCLAVVGDTGECLCLVERDVVPTDNWWNHLYDNEEEIMAEGEKKVWPMVILGGSETFEKELAALEDLKEEEEWMLEAEDVPASAEEVLSKIRLALGTRSPGGGRSDERPCGKETGPCCGGSCG